ncbi:MAG: c-type cytochrome [Anaerolineae bacterium]|nr:c-type cytochrome [Anaerolineae bacterium]
MKLQPFMAGNGRFLFLAAFILALLVVLASVANPMAAQEPTLPPVQPDAEIGSDIFQERCANCHGPAGQGDGELTGNLPKQPANYTETEFRRTRIPGVMYNTITEGILESGMPPFGSASTNPISDENRWHLVASVYSLATPPEAIASGKAVYEENCLACHGETGVGDGPNAADAQAELPDLTAIRYWFNRSNETVFADIESGGIPDHDYELTEQEQWDVVDYTRTFSYYYFDPNAPVEPIVGATISGVVVNGTSSDIVEGVEVILRGFSQDFQPTVTMTTTVDAQGNYLFELEPVDPNWVYLASARYNDLGFSSDAGQVSRAEPALALPITVFETTTDPEAVVVDQVHILLSFGSDTVRADEFYVFSNPTAEVFVGESGDTTQGTVRLALPEGAENIAFQRSFGSMQSSIPASEVIQLEDGSFADTFPLNPGSSGLNLIVSYELPYEEGMTVERPLFYETVSANVIIPDRGVMLAGDTWVDQGVQEMPGGSFSSYAQADIVAGSELIFELNGRPEMITDMAGNAIPSPANSTNELIVGGAVLLIVVVTGLFIVTRRDSEPDDEEELEIEQEEIDRLLLAVVDLDDGYEAGNVEEAAYQEQRQKLISQLAAIWPVQG